MDDTSQLIDFFSLCDRNPEDKNHSNRENVYTLLIVALGSFFLQENMTPKEAKD